MATPGRLTYEEPLRGGLMEQSTIQARNNARERSLHDLLNSDADYSDSIEAPKSPALLRATEMARKIPGAEFIFGGTLDALEQQAWKGRPSAAGAAESGL